GPLFGAMCLQGLMNSILPSWLGEAALVYLLKRFFGQGIHAGTAAILVVRTADLAFIFLMFTFMALFLLEEITRPFITVALVMLAIIAAATVFILVITRMGDGLGLARQGVAGKVAEHLQKLSLALADVRERNIMAPMLALTAAMWLAQYLVFVALVWALRVDLSLTVIFGVYLIGFSVNLLPVKGVANFGTHETAWFIALRAFGVDPSLAALLGFGSHVVILVMHALLGGPAAGYLYLGGNREEAPRQERL
ncbi:MAG: flippase-like domain-containing protein, partial [Nitrospinota bacterium]|nr:flippase-like domain-containing protein [Nitrospinota bacterium]